MITDVAAYLETAARRRFREIHCELYVHTPSGTRCFWFTVSGQRPKVIGIAAEIWMDEERRAAAVRYLDAERWVDLLSMMQGSTPGVRVEREGETFRLALWWPT